MNLGWGVTVRPWASNLEFITKMYNRCMKD